MLCSTIHTFLNIQKHLFSNYKQKSHLVVLSKYSYSEIQKFLLNYSKFSLAYQQINTRKTNATFLFSTELQLGVGEGECNSIEKTSQEFLQIFRSQLPNCCLFWPKVQINEQMHNFKSTEIWGNRKQHRPH